MNVAKKFLKSEKYKILAADPQDTMIPDLSSLKNGVARASLEEDIKKNTKILKSKGNFFDI